MNDEYVYLWAQWGILNAEQYRFLLSKFGDLESAWGKITSKFLIEIGFGREKAERVFQIRKSLNFKEIVAKVEDLNVKILCLGDEDYPSLLAEIHDPPPFIFVRGALPSFHKSLGVVGTRNITDYGRMVTDKMASALVYNGFVIVSGLALGVDACAHKTTIENKGITVAVLGSGVDMLYPSENVFLGKEILKNGGAIVSEYPFGTPPLTHHFPARNRIISGLSKGILVVEGGVKSGALITARFALEQGREVFAVPNNITKVSLSGTNHLIRRGEAKLVESVEHILEEFHLSTFSEQAVMDFDKDETSLLKILSSGGKTMDELIAGTAWNIARLSEMMTNLSLKKAVREEGVKWVIA